MGALVIPRKAGDIMAQTLAAVFKITDQYTTAITRIMKSQASFEKKQAQVDKATERFNKTMRSMKSSASLGASGIDSLAGKLGNLISIAYLGKKAFEGMFAAIKISAQQQVQKNTLNAITGSTQAGTALYSYISEYAKTSALGREDLTNAATSFLSYTRDINQIERLIQLIERLYAKDPTQGASGAVFALKELLSGDTMSIKDRYNMSGFSGETIRNFANSGDMKACWII